MYWNQKVYKQEKQHQLKQNSGPRSCIMWRCASFGERFHAFRRTVVILEDEGTTVVSKHREPLTERHSVSSQKA